MEWIKVQRGNGGVAAGQEEKLLFIFHCLKCSVVNHASLCVCVSALIATFGDINAAVERLLQSRQMSQS